MIWFRHVTLFLAALLICANTQVAAKKVEETSFEFLSKYDGTINSNNINKSLSDFEIVDKTAFNFGFKSTPTWFLFSIKKTDNNCPIVFEVTYPPIDSIALYKISNGKLSQLGNRGDMVLDNLTFKSTSHTFLLTNHSPNDTFLLSIKTLSANQFDLKLHTLENYISKTVNSHWFYAIFYGILISMLVYNLLVYAVLRYQPYIFYCIYLLLQVLMFSSINGHLFEFVFSGNSLANNVATIFSISFLSVAGILFTISFLNIKKDSRLLWYIYIILISINSLIALSTPIVSYETQIKLSMALGAVSSISVLVGGIISYSKGNKAARFFVLSWSLYLVSLVILVLLRFGFFGTSLFIVHLSEIGAVIETFLITLALIDQMNIIRNENKRFTNDIQQKADKLKLQTIQLQEHAHNLSHVLRKPIANIIGLTQMIKSSDNTNNKELLDLLDRSSAELDSIIKNESKKLEKHEHREN